MNAIKQTPDTVTNHDSTPLAYFGEPLPWHTSLWQTLTSAVLNDNQRLPHALLASSMLGIGKRQFVWRWAAWQLCLQKTKHHQVACGECESCQWLKAGTHPNLVVLPPAYSPTSHLKEIQAQQLQASQRKSKKTNKKAVNSKTANQNQGLSAASKRIKIDDIRNLQDFVHQSSQHTRICILEHADSMTLAAANALLKTLEEPTAGMQFILITDRPTQLLPTIKSRVQQLPLEPIKYQDAYDYVQQYLSKPLNQSNQAHQANQKQTSQTQAETAQLLTMTANAPLAAIKLADAPWYAYRQLWLTTWQAIKTGKRSSTMASDYWQKQLTIDEFMTLSRHMLLDLQRLLLHVPTLQQDVDYQAIDVRHMADTHSIQQFIMQLAYIEKSQQQNVQEKLAYDKLTALFHQL